MRFRSTRGNGPTVSFQEAVEQGLAPGGGLYLPVSLPRFVKEHLADLRGRPFPEIAERLASALLEDEIPGAALRQIVRDAFDFAVPVVEVEPGLHALELFHGPTLAFKDFGARFLARTLAWFQGGTGRAFTVLVATSGDTGSAVAHGFLGVAGARVVLLYPSGKVSEIQEKQLTTLGGNVAALEVAGNFDDCQRLVKQAFADAELRARLRLTSANSINVARLIPQTFYYFHAWAQLPADRPLWIAVPSGNFGNLCAGLLAKRMGLPVARFVAATNANDVVPHYLETGVYAPRPSLPTLSNAMDVGDPSNFERILALYGGDRRRLQEDVLGLRCSEEQTVATIRDLYQRHGCLLDPHGAVACWALKKALRGAPAPATGLFLATAHPAKFSAAVAAATGAAIPLPEALRAALDRPKRATLIAAAYEDLRDFLLGTEKPPQVT